MPTTDLTERILSFIGQTGYRPQKLRSLARSMGVAEDEYGQFRDAVRALMKTGRIVLGSSRVLTLPEPPGRIVGSFRLNPRGFGFVIPESPNSHGDLYVPPGQALDAITGDTVAARVLKRGKREGRMLYEGRIEQVLSRGQNRFVGELCLEFNRWYVQPDGNILHGPVFTDDPTAKAAQPGDQVVVEVTRYPLEGREARGVIVRVLGRRGEPEVDTLSIIVQHQLPEGFPEDVLAEAHVAATSADPETLAADREDLRAETVVTIDPDDARDFDDAISLRHLPGNQTELGVHIADVSHYVRPGTRLDSEARGRSNSIYFPRHVIPMLPEVLSNGLCSLQEGQPRLTKSAFVTYNRKGEVVAQRFANTLINSTKRLTYGQATAILEGGTSECNPRVVSLLADMDRLARAIRQRRISQGMIVLDIPEIELVYDVENRVTGVVPADTSFSHTIIEMFMVEANEAVARLFARLGAPHLRRIHPDPDAASGDAVRKFLIALGLKPPQPLDRFAMQSMLNRVKGRPESFAVNLALLRSMEAAEYSPRLIGHFALASEHYAHFTSPIRRYPDLTIHRLLEAHVRGQLKGKAAIAAQPSVAELTELGALCSGNERRAQDAERELKLVKILKLLEKRAGDVLPGVVVGVANFGVFVQLTEYLTDGLIRFADLSDDWWEVDTEQGCAVAERSGQRIRIGQLVQVTVAMVDVAGRRLDLVMAGDLAAAPSKGPKTPRAARSKPAHPQSARPQPARPQGTTGRPKRAPAPAPAPAGRRKTARRSRRGK